MIIWTCSNIGNIWTSTYLRTNFHDHFGVSKIAYLRASLHGDYKYCFNQNNDFKYSIGRRLLGQKKSWNPVSD